jgi:hypothetical protein
MKMISLRRALLALSGALFVAGASLAATLPPAPPAVSQITQTIDNSKRVTLAGNTNGYLTSGVDRGALAGNTQLNSMWLLLKRSPDREQALQQLIQALHDPNSPDFHQWLSAAQLGQSYGPDPADIATVKSWLQSSGFAVGNVTENGLIVEFSGTAAQVATAFNTTLHRYTADDGNTYISNSSDPSIPVALSPVVVGVVSLNNYFPRPQMHKFDRAKARDAQAKPSLGKSMPWQPQFTFSDSSGTEFAIAPGDFATIYNVGPVWSTGFRGAGQTIVVVEDTTIKNLSDVQTFRTAFGLSAYAGTVSQSSPTGALTCTAPGVNGAESEAALDAEWAGATAPDAAVLVAACKDTATNFGGLIAAENLLNSATPPTIISVSYGECEAEDGATLNAAFNSGWQQAAAEGASVFVSSGDESATSCDANAAYARHGIGVSGWASTPYNVAVGGTDFRDFYDDFGPASGGATGTPITNYWSATNGLNGGSALSYIPEIPWNDSCAGFFTYEIAGYTDPVAYCNSSPEPYMTTGSGSGGPSGCATGAATTTGVVSGTCAGYAKPYWQSGVVGIVNDGVRDIPDVSLFASNGWWTHFLWLCMTDTAEGGGTCDYANDPDTAETVNAAGGTSFSAPALAGIQALINQATAQKWGNMNTRYYALAGTEYGSQSNPDATNLADCNANNGAVIGGACIFRDVTSGDFDVPCRKGSPNCYTTSASTSAYCGGTGATKGCGVVSTSTTALQPAYNSTPGWDFTTGLGSLNVANLVNAMATSSTVTHLVFTTEPNASYAAGATITVKVALANTSNAVVTSSVAPVTLTLSGGTSGATLIGTATQNAVSGVATFNVAVDVAGTAYVLNATSGTLTPAASTPFNITAGAAAHIAFTTQPAAGSNIAPNQTIPVVVNVKDGFGNVVVGDNVTLALGSNTGGSTLTGGGTVATDSSGNATFTGVSLDQPGTGYTLVATDPTPLSVTSNAFNIAKLDQTITFTSTAPTSAVVGNTYTPTATSTSGLPVTITVDASSSSVCSISSGVVTFNAAGTCIIDANQAGNNVYNAAPQAQQSVVVGLVSQTITFTSTAPTDAVVGGATYTPTATASSGLPVTLTVDASASAVCTIDSGTGVVTFIGAGTCVIDANQAGNATYAPAPQVQQSFTVVPPTFVFTTEPADVTQGTALGTIVITEEDGGGNTIADNTTVVDFTIAACGGTVDLGSVTMVNGVATLNSTQVFYTVATGLQIQATAGAATVNSTTFDVTANSDILFADGFDGCRL